MTAKEILNKLKWTKDIKKAEIWYLHRGAKNDTKIISGSEILALGKSFFETGEASIPYHRIRKIFYDNELVWERKSL
ncbi:MAG: RNA repair domain-containing protein [Candidatus Thermoplasmatota archaeon]|nr:RNA repair domain-containing protein [Candidatus Thermoplasmatota archaeon]MDI6855430.1 RNA repair domain-containing protein [Candidatus Thermoplasmatota archaeon]